MPSPRPERLTGTEMLALDMAAGTSSFTTFLPRFANRSRSSSSDMSSMDAWRLMFSRTPSSTNKNTMMSTSQINHAVSVTTFAVMVAVNANVRTTGTTMPTMSAARLSFG